MPVTSLPDWIAQFAQPEHVWFAKRLSANDTLQTKAHQAGPYFPKDLLFRVLPALHDESVLNPRVDLQAFIDSHPDVRTVTPIWYNGKLFGKTRNETRVTGWGGAGSAVLDAASTGALAVFVFKNGAEGPANSLHVWVCDGYEDEVFEDVLGPVEPGRLLIWRPGDPIDLFSTGSAFASCQLRPSQMPESWLMAFPSAADIVRKAVELRPLQSEGPDVRLLRRRDCEFEIFKAVEEAVESPKIAAGFAGLGQFLGLAQTILQRRKSRSGRSLELQTREIFLEEGLVDGHSFSHGGQSENGKKPDFLFPSVRAYTDPAFPADRLRMLAAKTTARDRWRQILNEADRVGTKHLLTLQEGVSLSQFAEMKAANVQLVVPASLIDKYPQAVRPELMTLDSFIYEVRTLV
jgi:hypothetical protein